MANLPCCCRACQRGWAASQCRAGIDLVKAVFLSLANLADRHLESSRADRLALRWRGRAGTKRDFSFTDLANLSSRLAGHLDAIGLRPGEAVAVMTGRRPETVIAALAIWKLGGVFCPLFTDLGPDPLLARLEVAQAKVLLVHAESFVRAVRPVRDQLNFLAAILHLGETPPEGCRCLAAMIAEDGPPPPPPAAEAGLLHFTSGTTAPVSRGAGQPRAIYHDQRFAARLVASGQAALGIAEGDMLWCTGEPGWALHSAFGIIVPLALGAGILLDEAPPTPTRCLAVLEEEPVDLWYTTPTIIRSLMGAGAAIARSVRRGRLRLAASVGEPLSADAVDWGERALGVAFRDTWWQTETGGVVLGHPLEAPPRAGSMGRPLGGVTVKLVERIGDELHILPDEGDAVGEIALLVSDLAPWRAIGGEQGAPAEDVEGWHLTHDIARRDEAGNYFFLGRADEVVNVAGRMVGPFEIEAVLMGHPAVAEVGVVGAPDMQRHQHLVAFIALNPGFDPVCGLKDELLQFAVEHLGGNLAPDEIRFEHHLPRTSSGKIIRRRLLAKL
jgi:acetyl-CoA synthetase